MDFRKWEAVVVEWVNCLKLSKPISSLKDLNDGLFLSSLAKLLALEDANTKESLTLIITFLKEQYPNFIFEHLNDFAFQDLLEIDLLVISSLLLHYSCIFDRRDVLTSPLCHRLSQTTQVFIRSYLENMKNQITKEELFQVINRCINKNEIPKPVQTFGLQAGDSFLLCRSPLQDLLQTPPSKSARLQEKDREINKLRYDIDLERFEKTDLQHELGVQKERNKKLSQQMTDKTTEIIKLRTEIADIENKTLQDYQDDESRELQRRLRGEIDSLEKYIAQLQEEQDKLYNERDSIKERLKNVEGQYMIWHDKALTSDQKYENLLEKHQQQDLELQNLQSQCLELSALLEELRASRHCNESIEVDSSILENSSKTFRTVASSEDLACAVVEVQLRDAQKENNELNNLLQDSQENTKKLHEELLNVTINLADLQTDYEILKADNNDLLEKVSILIETQTTLQNTREELEQSSQEVLKLVQNNAGLNSEVNTLQKQMEETNTKLTSMEGANKSLTNDFATLQYNYTHLEASFLQKSENCDALEERVSIIQAEHNRLLDNYKKQDFKLQSVTKNFNQLTSSIEQSLQKLEKFVFGSNSIDLHDTNAAFGKIFSQLEQNYLSQLNEKEILTKNLFDFEELVLKLKADLAQLNEKHSINVEERQTLSQNLKCAEEKISLLENTIADHINKIQNLNCTISEMTTTIADLEMLKDVIEGKENVIADLEAANNTLEIKLSKSNEELVQSRAIQEDLHKSLENLEKIKNDFEVKILETRKELAEHKENEANLNKTVAELHALTSVFEQQISETTEELIKYKKNEEKLQQTLENLEGLKTSLEHQITDANDKILEQKSKESLLENNIFDQDKQYHENIKALGLEIEGYNTKINKLETELQECKLNYASAQNDLEIIAKSKQCLQDEIETCKNAFNKRINVLDATIHKLEEDLQAAIEEKHSLQENFEKKCEECEKLTLESSQDMSRYGVLEEELKVTMEKLETKELECTDKDNLLSKANQDLLKIKLDAEQKSAVLKNLEAGIAERDLKVEELTEHILEMDTRNEELSNKTAELRGECLILENLKTKLETKCAELESNAFNIVSELSFKNEQLDDFIKKYKHHQEKTEHEISELTNALAKSKSELQELVEVKNTLVIENEKQIAGLQDKILELNENIESLTDREMQYILEMHSIKDELHATVMKYTESLQILQEIEAENETQVNNLTENLHELIEKYNNLDKTHVETLLQLKNIQEHVEVLENYKIQLESKLIEQKTKYDEDYNSCTSSLNKQITDLMQRESELKAELLEITEKLNISAENNYSLNENFNKVCTELSQLNSEKALLCQNLNNFSDSYQELKNMYGSLKLTHIQFIGESKQNLNMLQKELSQQIGSLVEENSNLKDTIRDLQENLNILQAEQEVIRAIEAKKFEQKEEIIKGLEDDNKFCKEHINNLIEEKQVIQEQIALEKEKVDKCQKEFEETNQENRTKIVGYEANIMKFKCANDILETGKAMLQDEISTINSKIGELEEGKLNDKKRFNEEIQSREEEIRNFKDQIDLLQTQVSENVAKNTELMLELCTVNQSLDSLSKQHHKLQQILTEEKQNFTEKLLQAETESTDKQNTLENLKLENHSLSQEIATAKKEMENLKEKLKSHLMERQTLEVEIKTVNEKLLGQDSVVRRQEAAISEANTKVLGKLEEILELEKEKRALQEKLEELSIELDKAKRSRNEILESQAKIIKETENNLIRAHENAIEVKNDLLKRIELVENEKINEKQLKNDLEKLLEGEKVAKKILEIRVLELSNEKSKFSQLFSTLKHNVQSLYCALTEKPVEIFTNGETKEFQCGDVEYLNSNIEMIKGRILEVMEQTSLCTKHVSSLEDEKLKITQKIEEITNEKEMINQEKEKLVKDYNILYNEKIDREQELLCLKDTQLAHDLLKAKYEQLVEHNKNSENVKLENLELQEKIVHLEKKTAETYNTYKKYAGYSTTYKTAIEKLITERNVLDSALNNLKQNLSIIQTKMLQVSDDRERARLMEQVQSFEIISEDIQKQFLRISRKIHEIILMIIEVPADVYDIVTSQKLSGTEAVFDRIDFDEELEKVVDCRDRATDLLEQMTTFECSLNVKTAKVQKENVLRSANNVNTEVKVKDEELKKRNTMLKQRLTLAENARSNLEKKIKQLRQENKMLNSRSDTIVAVDNDASYKALLQQHIQAKQEYEKTLSDCKAQYNKLRQEHEDYKTKNKFIPEQIKYEKDIKTEQDVKVGRELIKLREAYGNVMSDNSKLDLENATMRKLLDDRTSQLSELKLVQESYEKLLEENNKLRMELDTMKYKRNRDREALLEAVKKDRNESKKLQEVRTEYEAKLEKMKEKMVQLYREEIDKEGQKHQKNQNEKVLLLKTIDQLKQKLKELKFENEKIAESRNCEFCSSRSSYCTIPDSSQSYSSAYQSVQETLPFKGLGDTACDKYTLNRRKAAEDRKYATLPRSTGMSIIEENAVLKRNTLSSVPPGLGQNLEMEDEDEDLFNNKYLVDLQEGRCVLPNGRESNTNRLSELKWRNSLCPPHLKSSYPAETQFSSPGQFKDEELKLGTAEFDDSMSSKLIPGEKPRKKDFGTTSYKKPGPPTPSKNGGRLSLQGNEPHPRDVLREQNESKTPKRTTPSRLKALFMGRNSSVRDNSEVGHLCITADSFGTLPLPQLVCDSSTACKSCSENCIICNALLMQRCGTFCIIKRFLGKHARVCLFLCVLAVVFYFNQVLWDSFVTYFASKLIFLVLS